MLIAITGQICSGKSTAIKLLKTSFTKYEYIDLDVVVKSFVPTPTEHSVEQLLTDDSLYYNMISTYSEQLYTYITNLDKNKNYIIEASSLYAYPQLLPLFDKVIEIIASDTIRNNNRKKRQLPKQLYDLFNARYTRNVSLNKAIQSMDIIYVHITRGTLLELRGEIEAALIRATSNDFNTFLLLNSISKLNDDGWDNPYHNINHTKTVLTNLLQKTNDLELGVAAIFHDFMYSPKNDSDDNLGRAEIAFNNNISKLSLNHLITAESYKKINNLIATSDYNSKKDEYSNILFESDISHFTRTKEEIIETEMLLFKEYQQYDFMMYRKEHTKILRTIYEITNNSQVKMGIEVAISWLSTFTPKIGWFCGSFNPFTIGHLDILQKAELQFDKVVIVQAQNPTKTQINKIQCESLNNECIIVENMPNAINQCYYTPTLIRGVRNQRDVEDSQLWLSQINELVNEPVQCTVIIGDQRLTHISSTFVRQVKDMGNDITPWLVS